MVRKIELLESSKRKLLGEGLTSCTNEELQQLEHHLERSLSCILARKMQVYNKQIEQLKEEELQHRRESNNAEQNIVSMERWAVNSSREIVQLDDAINNVKNMDIIGDELNCSIEQCDINSGMSKNQWAFEALGSPSGLMLLQCTSLSSSSFNSGLWYHKAMAEYYAKNGARSTPDLEQSLEESSIGNASQRLETNDQPNVVSVPNVFPDASNLSQNPAHGVEVVDLVDERSHLENVNNAEENIVLMEQYDSSSIGKIPQPVNAINNMENLNVNGAKQNIVCMEQRDTNSNNSKYQRAIKRINREYGITRADLLQQSRKKLEEVAAHFADLHLSEYAESMISSGGHLVKQTMMMSPSI